MDVVAYNKRGEVVLRREVYFGLDTFGYSEHKVNIRRHLAEQAYIDMCYDVKRLNCDIFLVAQSKLNDFNEEIE